MTIQLFGTYVNCRCVFVLDGASDAAMGLLGGKKWHPVNGAIPLD
jgi:hypothetical protein